MASKSKQYLLAIKDKFEIIPHELKIFIEEDHYTKYESKSTIDFPSGITGAKVNFFTDDLLSFFDDISDVEFEKELIYKKNLIPIAKLTTADILGHGPCILTIHPLNEIDYQVFLYDSDYKFLNYGPSLDALLQKKVGVALEQPPIPEITGIKYTLQHLKDRFSVVPTKLENFISAGLYHQYDGQKTRGFQNNSSKNGYVITFFDQSLLQVFAELTFDDPFSKHNLKKEETIPIIRLDHPKYKHPIIFLVASSATTEGGYSIFEYIYDGIKGNLKKTDYTLDSLLPQRLVREWQVPSLIKERYIIEDLYKRFNTLPKQFEEFMLNELYQEYEGKKIKGAFGIRKDSILHFFDKSLLDWFQNPDFDDYSWSNFNTEHKEQFRQRLIPLARIDHTNDPFPVLLAIVPDTSDKMGYRILQLTYGYQSRTGEVNPCLSFQQSMPLTSYLKWAYNL